MPATTLTITGFPGSYTVNNSALSYSNVLKVKREGIGYNIIRSGTPASNEVLFTASSGTLTFQFSFSGSISGAFDTPLENVYILYK